MDVPSRVGLDCRPDNKSGQTETGVATSGGYRFGMVELNCGSV